MKENDERSLLVKEPLPERRRYGVGMSRMAAGAGDRDGGQRPRYRSWLCGELVSGEARLLLYALQALSRITPLNRQVWSTRLWTQGGEGESLLEQEGTTEGRRLWEHIGSRLSFWTLCRDMSLGRFEVQCPKAAAILQPGACAARDIGLNAGREQSISEAAPDGFSCC